MIKPRILILVGIAGLVLGLAIFVVRAPTQGQLEALDTIAIASTIGGIGVLVGSVLFQLKSIHHSHDLLRRRTLRISEIASEQRASLYSVSSSVQALGGSFASELDRRQLEWFEAAEVLERGISDVSNQFARLAATVDCIEQREDEILDLQVLGSRLEAITRVCSVLPLRRLLPPFGGMFSSDSSAISPGFAADLLDSVFRMRPKMIVETGSGLSTLLIGYALEMLGSGHLMTLEHDVGDWSETMEQVRSHGLEEVVSVTYSPLKKYDFGGDLYRWYSLENTGLPGQIDLLLVGGPPADTNRRARYPAWPLLADRLSPRAEVFVDDAALGEEDEVVGLWLAESDYWQTNSLPSQKGAVVLTPRQ
jgi:hypothetical protein